METPDNIAMSPLEAGRYDQKLRHAENIGYLNEPQEDEDDDLYEHVRPIYDEGHGIIGRE
jgi:hypothetical protein